MNILLVVGATDKIVNPSLLLCWGVRLSFPGGGNVNAAIQMLLSTMKQLQTCVHLEAICVSFSVNIMYSRFVC